MTVKPETRLWKNLKKHLNDGEGYLVSRLESYVTPGFPDCLIFHNVTGFFTIELKIVQPNNKVKLSVFQKAWNTIHYIHGAPVYILVGGLAKGHVKLFHGASIVDLGQKTMDRVPGLYKGPLKGLDLRQIVAETPKLPQISHFLSETCSSPSRTGRARENSSQNTPVFCHFLVHRTPGSPGCRLQLDTNSKLRGI